MAIVLDVVKGVAGAVAMVVLHGWPFLFSSERPVDITKPLEDQQAMLGEDVVLSCELSKAGTPVRWLKDGKAIRKSQKYDLLSEGTRAMLVVRGALLKDSGKYTCETEASKSTASLHVEGKCPGRPHMLPSSGPSLLQRGLGSPLPLLLWPGWENMAIVDVCKLYPQPVLSLSQKRQTGSQRSWLTYRQRRRAQLCSCAKLNTKQPL